jgi:hypothetical protein
MILVVTLCFLCFTCAESAHHHKTLQAQLLCPVCHVIGHGGITVPTPGVAPAPPSAAGLYVGISLRDYVRLPQAPRLRPQTRAPPSPVS